MSRNIPPELVIATMLREAGPTGVHTHVRQLRRYPAAQGVRADLVTPFSWARPLTVPVSEPAWSWTGSAAPPGWSGTGTGTSCSCACGLRRVLATAGPCVVYTQGPPESRAALAARQGPHQRVVQAVHFRISQADEWADKGMIARDGIVFRRIRRLERAVLPRVDGLMYVSNWARTALVGWLPEAAAVRSTVIDNFVSPASAGPGGEPLADLVMMGHLEPVKNHRYMLEVLAEAARTVAVHAGRVRRGPAARGPAAAGHRAGPGRAGQIPRVDPGVRSLLPRYRAYVDALTPSHPRWRSSSRWRRACRSWRATSGRLPSCARRAWRPGSGRWTTRPRPQPCCPACSTPSRTGCGRRRGAGAVPPRVRRWGYRPPAVGVPAGISPGCIMTGRQKIL